MSDIMKKVVCVLVAVLLCAAVTARRNGAHNHGANGNGHNGVRNRHNGGDNGRDHHNGGNHRNHHNGGGNNGRNNHNGGQNDHNGGHHNTRCEEVQCEGTQVCIEYATPHRCRHHPAKGRVCHRVRITSRCVQHSSCRPSCSDDEVCHMMHHMNTTISHCRPRGCSSNHATPPDVNPISVDSDLTVSAQPHPSVTAPQSSRANTIVPEPSNKPSGKSSKKPHHKKQ